MRYTLFYNKLGIKLRNGKYIIMVLVGSNNLYTSFGNGRKRVRNWCAMKIAGKYIHTKEEILSYPKRVFEDECNYQSNKGIEREKIKKEFGYYVGLSVGGRSTVGTEYKHFHGVYSGAIKNAISFDEFMDNPFTEFPRLCFTEYDLKTNAEVRNEILPDEETLIRFCEKKTKNFTEISFGYCSHDYVTNKIKIFRQEKKKS